MTIYLIICMIWVPIYFLLMSRASLRLFPDFKISFSFVGTLLSVFLCFIPVANICQLVTVCIINICSKEKLIEITSKIKR